MIEKILKIDNKIPIIILSGAGTQENMQSAFRSGARDFINKPCSVEKIAEVIDRVSRS